MAVHRL